MHCFSVHVVCNNFYLRNKILHFFVFLVFLEFHKTSKRSLRNDKESFQTVFVPFSIVAIIINPLHVFYYVIVFHVKNTLISYFFTGISRRKLWSSEKSALVDTKERIREEIYESNEFRSQLELYLV